MAIKLTKTTTRHLVEFDGLKFWMRPQSIRDRIEATRIIKEAELFEVDIAQIILIDIIVVLCIDAWEGIEFEDGPAECNEANKITFAAQFPHVAMKLRQEYQKVLASAEKNSETSPGGSVTSNDHESARIASESQPTGEESQDAINAT